MIPLLSQSLCSKALLPQLGAAVRILSNVQIPWGLVKQMCTQQPAFSVTDQQQHCSQPHLASSLQQCRQLLSQASHLPVAVRGITTSTAAYDKKLSDILKLDRLQYETADAVEEIWLAVSSSATSAAQLGPDAAWAAVTCFAAVVGCGIFANMKKLPASIASSQTALHWMCC
jgi:hypothetical protein